MSSNLSLTEYGYLSSKMFKAKLIDLCLKDGVQTGPFGSQLHQKDYVQIGTPIITVEHLGNNRITHQNTPKVSNADKDRLQKYTLRTGDIVFSRVGSVDRRALVQPPENGWLFSGRCLRVRPNPEEIDSQWLSYFFGFEAFKSYIRGIAVGATMPSLNTKLLSEIPIYYPPLEEQKKIGVFLANLDDRITLLRETNQTLESIAQAIFKSWFVDFDPVRAKMEGRQPEGMDEETAALFPDSFEESELGFIPKGWVNGQLGDLATLNRSAVPVGSFNESLTYVGLEHIPRKELSLTSWGTAAGLESTKTAFSINDILFGKLRPYFHKVVLAPFDGICSTDILVCKPKQAAFHSFVTLHLFSDALVTYADRLSNGAKMPRINWKDLAAYPIAIPTKMVVSHFNITIQPLFERMRANIFQINTLANLRDTLLPRLISGQLRLPEAQEQVEDALS